MGQWLRQKESKVTYHSSVVWELWKTSHRGASDRILSGTKLLQRRLEREWRKINWRGAWAKIAKGAVLE